MATIHEVKSAGMFMGKLGFGTDLLEEITQICTEKDICLGRVEALGAVQKARLGYYNQLNQEYLFYDLNQYQCHCLLPLCNGSYLFETT